MEARGHGNGHVTLAMLELFDLLHQTYPFLLRAFHHDSFANQTDPEEDDRKCYRH
jgi:hypothetical protein